MLAKLLNAEE